MVTPSRVCLPECVNTLTLTLPVHTYRAAYVFTAEHDPLRDEGILHARRLEESGVKVTHRHSDIGIHEILGLLNFLPEAEELFREMTDFIDANL
jgi:acetyl esterase/lipase